MEGGAVGHNFEMGLPKDYPCQVSFNLYNQYISVEGKNSRKNPCHVAAAKI